MIVGKMIGQSRECLGFNPNPIFSHHFAPNHFAELFSVFSV